ncbi:MAG: InlB B-repeat-containing protein, partial [Clostridia bacterium]
YNIRPVPTIPTRVGYKFLGWGSDNTASATIYANDNLPFATADTSYYAKWEPETFLVNFSAGTGTYDGTSVTNGGSYILSYGAHYVPIEPVKTGYTFVGWTTNGAVDADGDPIVYTSNNIPIITCDITYFARYEINNYTITFDLQGGTYDGADSISNIYIVPYNSKPTPTAPKKDTFIFVGWTTSADGSGTVYTNDNLPVAIADTTYYAKWTEKTITIDYYIDIIFQKFADSKIYKTKILLYSQIVPVSQKPTNRYTIDETGYTNFANDLKKYMKDSKYTHYTFDSAYVLNDDVSPTGTIADYFWYSGMTINADIIRDRTFFITKLFDGVTGEIVDDFSKITSNIKLYGNPDYKPYLKLYVVEPACFFSNNKNKTTLFYDNFCQLGQQPQIVGQPTLEYAKFLGWSLSPDNDTSTILTTIPVMYDDLTLYAVFDFEKIKISIFDTIDQRIVYAGEIYKGTLLKNVIGEYKIKDGYDFNGVRTVQDDTSEYIGENYKMVDAKVYYLFYSIHRNVLQKIGDGLSWLWNNTIGLAPPWVVAVFWSIIAILALLAVIKVVKLIIGWVR